MQSSATPENGPRRAGAGRSVLESVGAGRSRQEWIRLSGYSESSHTAYASASLFRFRAVSLMFDVVSHEEW
jgi:hypothetical protein